MAYGHGEETWSYNEQTGYHHNHSENWGYYD